MITIWYLMLLILIMLLNIIEFVESIDGMGGSPLDLLPNPECNITLYRQWRNQKYDGLLSVDPTFWRYQTQTQFVLTRGLALELGVQKCIDNINVLTMFKAGRSGPVTEQYSYKALCKAECLENDQMHIEAMKYSGCTCLELSTQSNDKSYHIEGDWCKHNSAKLLCDILGYCGVWNCGLEDFMCPRLEWNKKMIPYKGYGNCLREVIPVFSKANTNHTYNIIMIIILIIISIFSLS